MRILALAFPLVCVVGCSMYGAPADKLHSVPPIHHTTPPPGPAVYNEQCTVDFHRKPQGVQRHGDMAAARINQGDTTVAAATKATSDTARVDLLVSGIAHYSAALLDDPFDAQATLKLALAYDKALHKGCALALLHRLDALAQNPKLAPEASARIDDIVDNPQWFHDYRKDALAAVNR